MYVGYRYVKSNVYMYENVYLYILYENVYLYIYMHVCMYAIYRIVICNIYPELSVSTTQRR